jgi:DNA polymerase IV (DinB-like DNA polymerase)
MKERIILHVDMDYFFAQIEERENPQFKGKPVVVGADPKGGRGRGVVSTANYEARKYGIKSGMPISKAWQLCPNAIFLPVNMELYEKVSKEIMEIVKKYSPIYEIASLDEAYLDLTEYSNILQTTTRPPPSQPSAGPHVRMLGKQIGIEKSYERVEKLAKKLKKEIFEKEKLTCTVGIGPNKTVAKLAAEKAKPNGLKVVKPDEIEKFLDPLDVDDLPGIGPKTAEKLRAIGINKVYELKKLSKKKLREMFGKVGEYFWERARGIDEEPVSPEEIIKSIGRQITFERDTRNPRLIFGTFEKMIKEVHQELIENNFSFKTITVICRYKGFETHTKSKTLKEPSKDLQILKKEAKNLLLRFFLENKKLIRLIGLRTKIR